MDFSTLKLGDRVQRNGRANSPKAFRGRVTSIKNNGQSIWIKIEEVLNGGADCYIGQDWPTSNTYEDRYEFIGSAATISVRDFQPGERLWFDEGGARILCTYMGSDCDYHYAVRDDGCPGSGPNGEWSFGRNHGGTQLHRLETVVRPSEPHIIGLSPEQIDPSAYDEFMRGL